MACSGTTERAQSGSSLPTCWPAPRCSPRSSALKPMMRCALRCLAARVGTFAPARISPLWVILFGFLVFGDLPDGYALIGMVIIVGSGLYVALGHHFRPREEPETAID